MDIAAFWALIEESRAMSAGLDEQIDDLTDLLCRLEEPDVIDFARIYDFFKATAYTWDLWAAAYVIEGRCGSDGFDYFRDWLIAQGRVVFERVLADPDSLADMEFDEPPEVEAGEFSQAAADAYGRITGEDLPRIPHQHGEPLGVAWDEDDLAGLAVRLPKLSARFK